MRQAQATSPSCCPRALVAWASTWQPPTPWSSSTATGILRTTCRPCRGPTALGRRTRSISTGGQRFHLPNLFLQLCWLAVATLRAVFMQSSVLEPHLLQRAYILRGVYLCLLPDAKVVSKLVPPHAKGCLHPADILPSMSMCDDPSTLWSHSVCCSQQTLTNKSAEQHNLYHNILQSTAMLSPSTPCGCWPA